MSPESLPVKLRQARRSMSLAEAAERSGIPEHRIRMYEEGDRQPYGKTLKRLAEAYGVPVQELVTNGDAQGGERRRRRSPVPAPRRRRRRRRTASDAVGRTLEVPVAVGSGQTVHLVIELVIRPEPPGAAADEPADGSAARAAAGAESGRTLDSGEKRTAPDAGQTARPSGVSGPASPARGPTVRPAPTMVPADPSRSGAERRDPLTEFRRAYREFRRDKK